MELIYLKAGAYGVYLGGRAYLGERHIKNGVLFKGWVLFINTI